MGWNNAKGTPQRPYEKKPSDQTKTCPTCKGVGQVYLRTDQKWDEYKDKWVPVDIFVDCPTCNAEGIVQK